MSFYYHTDRTCTEKIGRIQSLERLDLTETPQNDDIKGSLLKAMATAHSHARLVVAGGVGG